MVGRAVSANCTAQPNSDCDYNEGGPIWCPHCGNRTGSFYLKQVNSAEDELENRRVK